MKIHPKTTSGNVLFGTLFITGIICLYMGSYLALVRSENQITRRSMVWNMAIPIAEAGIEEAMTQLESVFPAVKETPGWSNVTNANGGIYLMKRRDLSSTEYFKVGIFPPSGTNTPIIVSEGFVRSPSSTNFISRTIGVRTKKVGYTMPGMVVVDTARLSGSSKMTVDSFNSTNALYSTNGIYDPLKRRDKAYLATISTSKDAIDLGNTQVWGKVATGHNGFAPTVGNQSSVGDKKWHDDNKTGIQPGAYTDDVNISIESVNAPTGGVLPPTNSAGVYVLTDGGNYAVDNLSGAVLVIGKARLLVTKSFNVSSLTISNGVGLANTASLELYVAAESVDISGNGQLNVQGRASNFKYYGLPENKDLNWTGNKTLKAGGNGQLNAMIYAPYTDLTLNGGGSGVQDFSGAALVKSATMVGSYSFHYDESCALEMMKDFVAISWDELTLTWDKILAGNLTAQQLYY